MGNDAVSLSQAVVHPDDRVVVDPDVVGGVQLDAYLCWLLAFRDPDNITPEAMLGRPATREANDHQRPVPRRRRTYQRST
jgi:hypothetical protein